MDAGVPVRRTQAERRAATRRALLDATVASLVEGGYSGTTTTEVTRRAGVSQGALFKHFPSRSALVAAAAEQLFEDLFVSFDFAFERSTEDEARIVIAIRRLWDVFCQRELLAVYRLYMEAPVDEELMAALVPVVKRHEANLTGFALRLFPGLAQSPVHASLFIGVVYAMQGLSLQRVVHVDPAHEALMLSQMETLARALFPETGREKGAVRDA
jgi:AcrR family transcriptional regulator